MVGQPRLKQTLQRGRRRSLKRSVKESARGDDGRADGQHDGKADGETEGERDGEGTDADDNLVTVKLSSSEECRVSKIDALLLEIGLDK
jgi:hypothetical protein